MVENTFWVTSQQEGPLAEVPLLAGWIGGWDGEGPTEDERWLV
jgi:hypothetical protein